MLRQAGQVDNVHRGEHQEQSDMPPSIERAMGPVLPERSASGPFSELASLCPVGVFDSGMGGLSVIAELRKSAPREDIIYYGDNANCPYGGRSDEWLRARSLEITDFLLERGAKAVVVACNAASAAGLEHLRALRNVPVMGLVPAVKPAVAATRTRTIGVLSTQATIRGRLLLDVIERFALPAGVEVVKVAPVGLVEAVEAGELLTPQTARAVADAVLPMLAQGVDAIVLGCTHYPFLTPLIREIVGDGVQIIDSGEGVARQTCRVLEAHNLLREPVDPSHQGKLTVYTSADPDVIRPVVWRLAGEEVDVKRET